MTKEDRRSMVVGVALLVALAATWAYCLMATPVDIHQGEVYRIIYIHVPSAISAFLAAFILTGFSIAGLRSKSEKHLIWQRAAAEVGLALTVLTLATGSIWGKPTWGTWWTWDARLTTTFLLALMFGGFLLLFASMAPGPQRVTSASVLGILIGVDVPIIYKSVTWWRTLHQPPSMMRMGAESTMSSEIQRPLMLALLLLLIFSVWVIRARVKNLLLLDELESAVFSRSKL